MVIYIYIYIVKSRGVQSGKSEPIQIDPNRNRVIWLDIGYPK